MRLDEAIGAIEGCETIDELRGTLQRVVETYGFANFAFIDVGHPDQDVPFVVATTEKAWDDEYRSHGFVHVDPILPVVRRTNVPFHWGSVPMPPRTGRRKSGALKTMEAARDHGLTEGLVIPFHFMDRLGRMNSASCVFFWKDRRSRFFFTLRHKKHDLHILMLYWAQRLMDVASDQFNRRQRFANGGGGALAETSLTDRERDALSWAARGKTMAETSTILSISEDTVETYLRNAMRKLGAVNKTQAVVRAIYAGLIDV